MDMKKLLEAITKFSGEPKQTPGDQVRGDEKAKPSKDGKHPFQGRLVGEMAKIEQEQKEKELTLEKRIAEKWQEFKDTFDKRPAREGSRHPRGHEPKEQYQVIQDESTEAEKRVQTKLKNIERLKTPISDKAWKDHQERMKKEREEYIKKNPDSIFKEEDVLSIKEDPFGQWVLVDKQDGHIKQAFDDKEHAYRYWDHFKLSTKDYKIMHGSEYVDSEYEELAEYGATSTGSQTSAYGTETPKKDPEAEKAVAQASTIMKQATGSSQTPQAIAKAVDSASQGKPVDGTDARTLEPVMDIVKKAAEDPKIAQQFKNLANQAKRN